jgi:hypothetical protein
MLSANSYTVCSFNCAVNIVIRIFQWNSNSNRYRILYAGEFLFVRYSFLLISNKFCDLTLLPWVGRGGRGEQCGKKNLLHWGPLLPPPPYI